MQRVNRLKFIILAMIACAVLFCIAAFSVSFAKWTLGDDSNATKEIKGNASNFYVEYPRYVTNGSNVTDIPQLDSKVYYLQVPQHGNTSMSDYYSMWENPNPHEGTEDPEKMVTNVPLYANDTFSIFKGTTKQPIKENRASDNLQFNVNTQTCKVTVDGYYNIYFEYKWTGYYKIKVVYVGALNSGNTGNTENNDTLDTTGYEYKFSVKFTDDPQEKQLWFKTGKNASGLFANLNNLSVHLRADDWSAYYFNTKTIVGQNTDGNMSNVSNITGVINVGTKDKTVIIIGFEDDTHLSNSTTAAGQIVNGKLLNTVYLADFAVGEINLITLHTAKNGFLTHSGSGGGSSEDITPAEPDFTGLTDLSTTQLVENDKKKTVRLVNATTTANGETEYVYKNYICVSRKNSATTDDDNSIAYLEFEVTDCSINPYNVQVKSLKIKRRATDANGNIKSRFINPAPRIYNYDSKIDTRLGPDTSANDYSDPNKSDRKPLFARGKTHVPNNSEGAGHMKNHFDDGVYVVLYFGDSDQQYFALDIEIVTNVQVDFKLNAEVANKNSWERYEDGYGEPWGYYMGGLINSVETWDPSRTTKLERASTDYVTDYNAGLEKDIVGNIETASDATIKAFNKRNDFNYKIIKFYKSTGDLEGYARYPKGKIDVSLTVNLTEDSRIKMYMVDHDGHRINGHTVYVVPSEIAYDKETKKLFLDETYDIYDDDLNIIIPKTGTYIFRLTGYFHTRDEETEGHNGDIIKGKYIRFKEGTRVEDEPAEGEGMGLPNFNLFVDTLYITCSTAAEGNSECTITLNANGGKFADADGNYTLNSVTGTVTFGSDIKNLPQPKLTGKTLLGWTYVDDDGKVQDFDFGSPVTGNMTLTAKWSANYTITFDANGGEFESGTTKTETTNDHGKLSVEQLDAITTPTRAHHEFMGWYTTATATGGKEITASYAFTNHTTVYARWKEDAKYTVKFNLNGMPGTAPAQQTMYDGEKATEPTVELPDHYKSISWNTKADGTGTTYNFNSTVNANIELFAKWTADNGVYINGVYAGLLEPNTDKPSVTSTRLKALGVLIKSGQTAKFWYNNKNITSALYIRNNSPAASNMSPTKATGTSYNNTDGLTSSVSGWYDMYYEDTNGNGSEGGIWLILAHAYADLELNEANDGLYNGDNRLEKFTVNEESSYELKATVTLTSNTTISIKYKNTVQSVTKKSDSSLGTFSGGKVTLGAGTYTVYYDYIANTVFVEGKYLITFDANNGSWSDGDTTKTALTGKIESGKATVSSLPANPSRGDKYTFNGWYTATTGGSSVTTSYQFSSATTVYAQWTQVKFDITFNLNGGNVGGSTADKIETTGTNGKLTALPDNPTRTNYKFTGWYNAADGGSSVTVNANTTFSSNTTLYAHWAKKFSIEYANLKGASNTNTANEYTDDTTLTLVDLADLTDFKFDGWTLDGNNISQITASAVSDKTAGATLTLTATWKNIYTVTFHWNYEGAPNNGVYDTIRVADGSSIASTDMPDDPERTEFTFKGWYKDASCNNAWSSDTAVSATQKDLYAQWEEASVATTYRVILDVSNWPGYNHATAYTYHVYPGGTGDGEEMVSMGSNKYYFDLTDTGITKIRFTQDQHDTSNELSRYEVSVSGLALGNDYTYTPTKSNVTIDGTRQIGLWFNDGIVILNASYNTGWTDDDHPNQIYMWKKVNNNDTPITAKWSGSQAGDNIVYGKFTQYNANLSDVYGIILAKDGSGWTGDIKPGQDNYDNLANGKVYNIKYGEFKEKTFSDSGDADENITIRFTGPYWADSKSARVSYVTDNSTVNDNYDSALEMTWESDDSGYIVIPKPTKIRMFFKQDVKWISSEITMSFEAGKTYTMTNAQYTSDGNNNTKNFTASITVS